LSCDLKQEKVEHQLQQRHETSLSLTDRAIKTQTELLEFRNAFSSFHMDALIQSKLLDLLRGSMKAEFYRIIEKDGRDFKPL